MCFELEICLRPLSYFGFISPSNRMRGLERTGLLKNLIEMKVSGGPMKRPKRYDNGADDLTGRGS